MSIFVCEYEFDREDPNAKGYSMCEVDYYSWTPWNMRTNRIPNHRLSLRKNLVTNEYEAFRQYYDAVNMVVRPLGSNGVLVTTGNESIDSEVVFHDKSLQKAVDYCNDETQRYHSNSTRGDRVCTHIFPNKSRFCEGPRS